MSVFRILIVAALTITASAAGHSAPADAVSQGGNVASEAWPLIERGLYAQAETVAQADVDRLMAASADPLSLARASDVLIKTLTLNGKGSLPTTVALAERTLSMKESFAGRKQVDIATSLTNLGTSLGEAAMHPRAIALLQRAVSLLETDIAHSPLLADTLDALGLELIRAGRLTDAIGPLRRSLNLREAEPGDTIGLETTLNALVLALQRKGDYAESRIMLDRALQVFPERVHPVHVTTLTLSGQQLWFEGSWLEARSASARAVELAERVLRPDHPDTAVAIRYLAATLLDLGDIAQAKRLHERALGMAQRSLGAQHHEMSAYLSGLGESTRLSGDYAGARALYERALAIAEPRLGRGHMWVAGLLHNLALVDAQLGDYAGAQRQQARAMAIWEQALGRDHAIVAVALTELAAIHRDQGSFAEAIRLLERALSIRERRLGPDHRDVARTLIDLSATLFGAGHSNRARQLATRAFQLLDRVDATDTPDLAAALDLYAQLQMRNGDYTTARNYLDRALDIRRRTLGAAHPLSAETQTRLAVTLAFLGDTQEALMVARSAETIGREHLRLMLRYLPERQSLGYAATRPRALDLILSLVGDVPEAVTIAADELIRGRALVLDEMARRLHAMRNPPDDSQVVVADLAQARQRLVNLVVRGPGDLPSSRYGALVDEARRESERAERLLAERSATFRAELDAANVGLEEVRAALPINSALVCFVRYQRTAMASPLPAYLAFVLRPGRAPVAVPLGTVASIDPLVSQWRSDVAAEVSSRVGAEVSSRVSGARLRRAVWDLVADYLKGTSQVFIVPDGTLSLVPFAALPTGRTRYVIDDGPVLHYISAERDLAVPGGTADRPGTNRGLLALGGPSFDDSTESGRTESVRKPNANVQARTAAPRRTAATTNCDSLSGVSFAQLDGSLREVQEVARLWNTPSDRTARVLIGRDANERTFKNEATRYGVLHLATHGFFLSDSCAPVRSAAGTRAVAGLTTAPSIVAAAVRRESPLLLSGLALAGANRRASARPDDDDGILTAEEVASLNLSGVEWAVLSACGTGLGAIQAGEGVFGLRRAFQIAGARTVIMSLWSVDDQATREWMVALYDGRFQKHLSTADAVHAATLAMLRDRRGKGLSTAPFYWAAFVAAGDWR